MKKVSERQGAGRSCSERAVEAEAFILANSRCGLFARLLQEHLKRTNFEEELTTEGFEF